MTNKLHEYIESLSLEEREQYEELIHKALDRDAVIQYSREITKEFFQYIRQNRENRGKIEEELERIEREYAGLEILATKMIGEEIRYH